MKDVIVIGGGKRRLKDFAVAKAACQDPDPLIIMANHHPPPWGAKPDYRCYLDDIDQLVRGKEHPIKQIRGEWDCETVSIRPGQADIVYPDFKRNKICDSGMLSVFHALLSVLGFVYLCGFDLRENENIHVIDDCCKKWQAFLDNLNIEVRERLIPVSGPLMWMVKGRPTQ